MFGRRLIFAPMVFLAIEGLALAQSDDQLVAALRKWDRRAVVIVELGERLKNTAHIHQLTWEVYRVKVLATVSGKFDPAEQEELLVYAYFYWSYDIPQPGAIAVLAIYKDDDLWFLEQETCSYMPKERATLSLQGDVFATIEQCRKLCAADRRKYVDRHALRVAEIKKGIAKAVEKYESEKKKFNEELKAAQEKMDKLGEQRARSSLEWAERYYPKVIEAGKQQLAGLDWKQ